MKEFCAFTTNTAFFEKTNGKLGATLELIFILSEPVYAFDSVNDIVKSRSVSDVRFSCQPQSLRKISATLAKIADDAERTEKKFNDQIEGDPPPAEGTPA